MFINNPGHMTKMAAMPIYGIGEFNIGAPKACLQLKSKTTQSCFNIGLQRVCNPFVVKNELG